RGFGTQLWRAEPLPCWPGDDSVALQLSYTSEDGEQGFPGRMEVRVRYTLAADASWRIDYEATTDRPTVVNLSHHDYFNLAGSGSALQHRLMLAASRYSEAGPGLIPRGVASVEGTPFDFRQPTVIETRIRDGHPQLSLARGYDHNWWLEAPRHGELHLAARLEDAASGRVMTVETTEPAIQFYSGNFLDGSLDSRGDGSGRPYRQGDGVCLETQHAPDSPNQPEWPSTVLRPGEVFRSSTVQRFGVSTRE
ncbi:MAG TPA: aldose epimerase family protein, partial [Ideonella sp.]|nr:aldose epimerase family protein [Ideonella sp.]